MTEKRVDSKKEKKGGKEKGGEKLKKERDKKEETKQRKDMNQIYVMPCESQKSSAPHFICICATHSDDNS